MSVMGSGILRNAPASTAPTISKEMSSGMETITAGIQTTQNSAGVGGIKTAVEAFSAEKMGSMQTIQSAKMTSIASVAGYPSPTAQLKQSPTGAKYQKVLQHMENPKFQISKGLHSFVQMKLSSQIAKHAPAPPPPAGPKGIPTPFPVTTDTGKIKDSAKVEVPNLKITASMNDWDSKVPGRLEYPNIVFHLPEGQRVIDAEGFSKIAQALMRTEASALNLAQMSDALNKAAIDGGLGHEIVSINGGSGNDYSSIKGGSGNDS